MINTEITNIFCEVFLSSLLQLFNDILEIQRKLNETI